MQNYRDAVITVLCSMLLKILGYQVKAEDFRDIQCNFGPKWRLTLRTDGSGWHQ
jgi:hypothetical protein